MPSRLISWLDEAARWGPTAPVMLVAAVALIEAILLPRRLWAKGIWVLAVAACAGLAAVIAGTGLQSRERATELAAGNEIAALRGLWTQWDAVSRSLPSPPGESPAASFDTVDDALASLSAQFARIQTQIAAARQQQKGRSIDDETAAKLIDYLRQYGGQHALVSCVPDDVEAYTYANQLINILRMGGWDARGPEATANLGEAQAMGVSLYVRDPRSPEAAKILLDAFTRFNIAFQPGVAASEAIPDAVTVEIFVPRKP